MQVDEIGVLIPIIVPVAAFAFGFGAMYLKRSENLAMIERGMDPRQKTATTPKMYITLKYGLLLAGVGLGLVIAYLLDKLLIRGSSNSTVLYFAMIGIFGGLGLVTSYIIEKKYLDRTKKPE